MVRFLGLLTRVRVRLKALAEMRGSEFHCGGDRNHGMREEEVGQRLFLSPGRGPSSGETPKST